MGVRVLAALALWLVFGAFSFTRTDYPAPGTSNQQLIDVALADVDRANGLDIVASSYSRNQLLVWRNRGDGTFAAPVGYDACGPGNDGPWQIVSGQFDPPDTRVDIAIACGSVTIVRGTGLGGFYAPQKTAWPTRGSIAAGELTGSAPSELVFGTPSATPIHAVLCFLKQPFLTATPECGNPMDPQPPPLTNFQQGTVPGAPMPVVAEFITPAGAQRHDEVFGLSTTQADGVNLFRRDPLNEYESWASVPITSTRTKPYFVDVADVEPDGKPDLLVGHLGGVEFDLFRGGQAPPKVTSTLAFDTQAGRLADFDVDRKLDAVILGGQGKLAVHKGMGDGTFSAGQELAVAASSSGSQVALEVGDLNGDKRPDIVTMERHSVPATPNAITVLTSKPPPVGPPKPPVVTPQPSIKTLKTKLVVGPKGKLSVGSASNPPTAETAQKLVAGGKLLGRGRTTIPAGQTKRLTLKLNRKARRRLERAHRIKAKLTITATGPTGQTAVLRKTVRLRRPKP
jgi:VCBS repeat protein